MVNLTPEEQLVLNEANSFVAFESHPLWVKIREFLQEEMDDIEVKLAKHFANEEYPDSSTVFRLSLQKYERQKVLRDVQDAIQSAKSARDQVLEALKEGNNADTY
jgi:hypothetical protein